MWSNACLIQLQWKTFIVINLSQWQTDNIDQMITIPGYLNIEIDSNETYEICSQYAAYGINCDPIVHYKFYYHLSSTNMVVCKHENM
jgi:hypothetical protein